MSTLAERMKWARDRLAWSQPELAKRARVAQGTIGNLEAGTRQRPRDLLTIAQVLGVHPQWLEDGTGPRLIGETNGAEGSLSAADLALLADFYELLPEERQKWRDELHGRAEYVRKIRSSPIDARAAAG